MSKRITVKELKQMQEKEGMVFQGCGEKQKKWEDGANELLIETYPVRC